MTDRHPVIRDLVVANRILANENIVDAYGHVSVRHPDKPDRFFLARSRAPELVDQDDIMELTLDGEPVNDDRSPYLERFIHGAIYEARPDVHAVVHAHAEDVLPFGIAAATPLRPVIHSGSFMGAHIPVWDIADKFGTDTDLLVRNMSQGRDLAKSLGGNNVALMRGHGFASAARSLIEVVRMSVYIPRNARAQMKALALGGHIKPLHEGEINARSSGGGYKPNSPETWRAWEYWAARAGCGHMTGQREHAHSHANDDTKKS
jgi:HCOMODA/2-hydroxy-3-carboxy-muconic semialdehyde decarboxylase